MGGWGKGLWLRVFKGNQKENHKSRILPQAPGNSVPSHLAKVSQPKAMQHIDSTRNVRWLQKWKLRDSCLPRCATVQLGCKSIQNYARVLNITIQWLTRAGPHNRHAV